MNSKQIARELSNSILNMIAKLCPESDRQDWFSVLGFNNYTHFIDWRSRDIKVYLMIRGSTSLEDAMEILPYLLKFLPFRTLMMDFQSKIRDRSELLPPVFDASPYAKIFSYDHCQTALFLTIIIKGVDKC